MVKWLKNLGKIAIPALFAASCYSGQPIAGNYPALTDETKKALEAKVLNIIEEEYCIGSSKTRYENCATEDFNGVPREFANYFLRFAEDEYKKQNVEVKTLDNAEIILENPEEVDNLCNRDVEACSNGNLIIMPDDFNFVQFFAIFFHEYGHYLAPNSVKEYASIANEIYALVKLYQFSKPIGSIFANLFVSYPVYPMTEQAFYKQYANGYLFAPLNLSNNQGNIEKAMDFVLSSPLLDIETALNNELKAHSGEKKGITYFKFMQNLLSNNGFKAYLQSHISLDEAEELIAYLDLTNKIDYSSLIGGDAEIYFSAKKEMEDFIKNPRFSNPLFKADIVTTLTAFKSMDLANIDFNNAFSPEMHNLSKEIIDINNAYPCRIKDPYVCPKFARNSNEPLLGAYRAFMFISYYGNDDVKRQALNYAIDFLERFYPGYDFKDGQLDAIANAEDKLPNNTLPLIMVYAGMMAKQLGFNEMSEKFFNAGLAAECNDLSPVIEKATCERIKEDIKRYLGQ